MDEVRTLKSRIRSLIERDINVVNVVQVMLVRRTLPCQRRPLRMWEFNPEGPRTLQHFFGTTHEGMWKLFFGKRKQWPDTTKDIGLDCNHPDTPVSTRSSNTLYSDTQWQDTDRIILFQGWIKKVERIRCLAPLPKDSASPMLTRMLASAPYQAPARGSKEEGEKTQDDLGVKCGVPANP